MELDVMCGGLRLRDAQTLSRELEAAGMSGLVVTEGGRTAYLTCAAAALASERITIGTGVAVAFPRSPMVTAKVAWELADATGGRFELGLGTQVRAHIERRYSEDFDPPGPRMRDYVLALRAIFRAFQGKERLNYEGQYYRHTLLPANWTPGPIAHPDVRILVAAVGPWMLRMAGEVADGVHVHPFHSSTYLREVIVPGVAEGAARAGRDAAAVTLSIPVFTVVGDTEEERAPWKAMARQQISFYGSTRNYANVFDQLGFEGTSARLNERLKAGDMAGMANLITDEMLQQYAVTATWDGIADALRTKYEGVGHRIILYFATEMWRGDPRTMQKWGEVAAALR